ncbi:MAG: 1,4-dihydroxy-2-naphthoate octaprenyltransferase [Actinomycetota bacterium]|nr:1,4-dihydroxy-2-naphthoate octaprenyltransferase [Actinomycetota bacterium]
MSKIKIWLKAIRAPFFQAAAIPATVGAIVAWHEGVFHLGLFLLTLVGVVSINGGTNLANDYYDHLSRDDDINRSITPFSGGSRVIQEGLLSAREVYIGALLFFTVALLIGLYLGLTRGLPVLILGAIGLFIGYFYTAEPLKFSYRGVGELLVGVTLGPLVVLGSYYVQAQRFSLGSFWASLPVGLLVAGILYVNEFPDYEPDKAVGKNHLIVRLGPEKAVGGYYFILALTYLTIIAGVLWGIMPMLALIALVTTPVAVKAAGVARAHHSEPQKIIPAMASTIALHLSVGLLICVGYILDKLF